MDGKGFVAVRMLLVVVGFGLVVMVAFQFLVLPHGQGVPPRAGTWGSVVILAADAGEVRLLRVAKNGPDSFDSEEEPDGESEFGNEGESDFVVVGEALDKSLVSAYNESATDGVGETTDTILRGDEGGDDVGPLQVLGTRIRDDLVVPSKSEPYLPGDVPWEDNATGKVQTRLESDKLLETVSTNSDKSPTRKSASILVRRRTLPTSLSQMNSLLIQSIASSPSVKSRWSSARDRELLSAKLRIQKAPIARSAPGLHAPIFRNVSTFKRSYELMERMLKVYVYKEGEKPIFHQPKMRGIYASEGWFMKLMEGNKQFTVRDPRKAHLFYLPFSPQMLRNALYGRSITGQKDMEEYLKSYVSLLARKYRFWNRTKGADHFLVGCHDWASKITRQHMGNCIRVLCNSNVARGFNIGKDTTLPVTYIRSTADPQKDLGGKPPTERSILAFFAGSMHGYLRPVLLQHWENKQPDMKIFGPMPRDPEGKKIYREYMKSSKYCICARGYEVHTPRVVESILYECVPVIISDNYVPPFFELINWESFAVFVEEKDVPNLRSILLSIPQERYLEMQLNVKMVQQHFLWHRQPVKYDLFHMILHAVWYNRVFQIPGR